MWKAPLWALHTGMTQEDLYLERITLVENEFGVESCGQLEEDDAMKTDM